MGRRYVQLRHWLYKRSAGQHKFIIAKDEAIVVRRLFKMYADGMSTAEIAKIFNEEGLKPPSQVWYEKGIRKAEPKGGAFVWQHSGMRKGR